MRKFWARPSSYVILVLWGTTSFGYIPTFAAFLVHFIITPLIMVLVIYLARQEAKQEERNHVGDHR